MNQISDDRDWQQRHDTLFQIRLSALYHRERENFFDSWDKAAKFIAVALGAAAVSKLIPSFAPTNFADYLVAVVTIASASTLVFGVAEKARRHADLALQYGMLEASLIGAGEREFTPEQLRTWNHELTVLEAKEPRISERITKLCEKRLRGMYAASPNTVAN